LIDNLGKTGSGVYMRWVKLFVIAMGVLTFAAHAEDKENFQKIYAAWTDAFNHKKLPEVCALFSKSVIGDYRGVPQKRYSPLCGSFKKIFQENDMSYHNEFKIHEIYYSNDLAAVRITW
jgi:hypothetical protein